MRTCQNCEENIEGSRPNKKFCSRRCKEKNKRKKLKKGKKNRRLKGTYCEVCGPQIAYHYCQLDLDHKDGNNKNYHPSNIQTLCANCHRLKTFISKDYLPKTSKFQVICETD